MDSGDRCWEGGTPSHKIISSRTSERWSGEAATEPWFSLGKFYRNIRTQRTSTGKMIFNLRWWGSSDRIWGDRRGKPNKTTLYSLKVAQQTLQLSQSRSYSQKKSKTRTPGTVSCIDQKKRKSHFQTHTMQISPGCTRFPLCANVLHGCVFTSSSAFQERRGENVLGRRLTSGFSTASIMEFWSSEGMNHQEGWVLESLWPAPTETWFRRNWYLWAGPWRTM